MNWRKIAEQHFKEYLFLLDLPVEAARTCLEIKDMTLRVVKEDGTDKYVTMDVDDERVNVIVENGIVVGIDSIS